MCHRHQQSRGSLQDRILPHGEVEVVGGPAHGGHRALVAGKGDATLAEAGVLDLPLAVRGKEDFVPAEDGRNFFLAIQIGI